MRQKAQTVYTNADQPVFAQPLHPTLDVFGPNPISESKFEVATPTKPNHLLLIAKNHRTMNHVFAATIVWSTLQSTYDLVNIFAHFPPAEQRPLALLAIQAVASLSVAIWFLVMTSKSAFRLGQTFHGTAIGVLCAIGANIPVLGWVVMLWLAKQATNRIGPLKLQMDAFGVSKRDLPLLESLRE